MSDTLTLDDLEAIKHKQQATWSSGDYGVIGTTLQIIGESLLEALDLDAGSRVLDVAAGNGNATLAAARRGCQVTATDYVEGLLEQTRRRAEAEGAAVDIQLADAENLPFEDGSFDAVMSTIGVMFTPNPARAAAELVRVCRPGGKIGLANWSPDGFVGGMFKIIGRLVPPPAGVPSPMAWGTEERLQELFGAAGRVEATRREFIFRYRSPEEFFETFQKFYGPTVKAWDALDADGRATMRSELTALAAAANQSQKALRVPGAYVEVVVTRS
jgi:ubiquinone/menaquinone biosynthesis C-methylase UbiE